MPFEGYKDLVVWQEAVRLSLQIYKVTARFPDPEKFGLVSQLRRCSISIPSNIAEGHARLSTREFLRHISIALGSIAELETQTHISGELGYVSPDSSGEVLAHADRLGKQLPSLTKSLERRLASP